MISIRSGHDAATVLGHLQEAKREADNFLGAGNQTLADYMTWATSQVRKLGPSISSRDLDRLVTTRRYWALLGLMDLAVSSKPGLAQLITVEMEQRKTELETEARELVQAISDSAGITGAVIDTNVLLVLGDGLESYAWHELLEVDAGLDVTVWIPMAVVDELDRLKRDRGVMFLNGAKPTKRALARIALRTLDSMFPEPKVAARVDQLRDRPRTVRFRLIPEELGHVRLPTVDAEVIDQAVSLGALGGHIEVITYDTGMRFRARSAQLAARQLNDPEDE